MGPRKQLQIRRLARAWLAENDPPFYDGIRFDVVGLLLDPSDRPVSVEVIRERVLTS